MTVFWGRRVSLPQSFVIKFIKFSENQVSGNQHLAQATRQILAVTHQILVVIHQILVVTHQILAFVKKLKMKARLQM